MPRYSPERKEALLKKLLPPHNLSVAEVARQEGISDATSMLGGDGIFKRLAKPRFSMDLKR